MKLTVQVIVHPEDDAESATVVREVFAGNDQKNGLKPANPRLDQLGRFRDDPARHGHVGLHHRSNHPQPGAHGQGQQAFPYFAIPRRSGHPLTSVAPRLRHHHRQTSRGDGNRRIDTDPGHRRDHWA